MNLQFRSLAVVALSLFLVATGAHADGPFLGVKANRTDIDYVQQFQPSQIQVTRSRPALFAGYRFANGFELALERWAADTGTATCPPDVICPLTLVAVRTHVRLVSLTAGYEWPLSNRWSFAARVGAEFGRFEYSTNPVLDETSALAGVTLRVRVADGWSVGLDVSASDSETRSIGAELRFGF